MGKALIYELGRSISFGRLPLLAKVLWPMLLAASDDQGRGLAEPDVIKWMVCPNVQEITTENIPDLLQAMVEQSMIEDYHDSRGRRMYQIVRWWEYQRLQWAQPSQYEAPPGWADRIRYRANGKYQESNWPGCSPEASPERSPEASPERSPEALPERSPEASNQTKPNQSKPNQDKQRQQQQQPDPDVAGVVAMLRSFGLSLKTAENLAKTSPLAASPEFFDITQRWIRYARESPDIQNPHGFVRTCLETGDIPSFLTPQEVLRRAKEHRQRANEIQ